MEEQNTAPADIALAIPTHARLHYRGRVHVAPRTPRDDSWSDLVMAIRWWIGRSRHVERNTAFTRGKWMLVGGDWSPPGGKTLVRTRKFTGTGNETEPQYWALAFRHPCSDEKFRRWQTNIAATRVDSGFDLSVSIHHWISDNYIGEEPASPFASAPGIISRLIENQDWVVSLGAAELRLDPLPLREGDGEDLKSILADPNRECPLVFVSRHKKSGKPLVDATRIARLLAGSALVYAAETSGTDTELEWILPRQFRCQNGMVRVYLPEVQFDQPHDSGRHRFFLPDHIESLGPTAVERLIVEGLARRHAPKHRPAIDSLSELVDVERRARFELMRPQEASGEDQEWQQLLEEEVERLTQQESRFEAVKQENDDLRQQLQAANYLRDDAESRAKQARLGAQRGAAHEQVLEKLLVRPATLIEGIELIETLFPDSIAFTDDAKQSARKAEINDVEDELAVAWRMLWHMATTLHDMSFRDEDKTEGSFDEEFHRRSGGIELALTEKKQTKKDARLRNQRKVSFEGQELDITPHLKHRSGSVFFRVHYAAMRGNDGRNLIVVGHCGDHLDTAGTRKRK